MFCIVCPLLFLAGLVDSIGGGGGLISLPAYLFAGLPVHMAIATNKLSSACGTSLAVGRFIRRGLVKLRLAVPSVAAAVLGSTLGAKLSLSVSETVMKYILFAVLPIAAAIVMNRRVFRDEGKRAPAADGKTLAVCILSAFLIGMYDGFYGPGTGTFLIISFTVFAGMTVNSANAQSKVINLTSNITSLTVFSAERAGADPAGTGRRRVQHGRQLGGLRSGHFKRGQDRPAGDPAGAASAAGEDIV